MTDLKTRYVACMVLGGTGDALGYKGGEWEFCRSGEQIHKELADLGGIENIDVALPEWIVSDDTVMHLATAEALVASPSGPNSDRKQLYLQVCVTITCVKLARAHSYLVYSDYTCFSVLIIVFYLSYILLLSLI